MLLLFTIHSFGHRKPIITTNSVVYHNSSVTNSMYMFCLVYRSLIPSVTIGRTTLFMCSLLRIINTKNVV